MPAADFVAALMKPEAYGHPCGDVRLVETHISWVFLTGDYAYKVKKPVQFNFVDFSTAELRAYYCDEEVRCNQAFSPELYVGVVSITQADDGSYRIDGPGKVVEAAVKMREFPGDQQLDNLLEAGMLSIDAMRRFGLDLADQHASLPRLQGDDDEVDTRVLKPVLDNFRTLNPLAASLQHERLLSAMAEDSRSAYDELRPRFVKRLQDGFVRECHGDLHLSNLVMLHGRVRAFDCLEFNANLRWIDTSSDVAFLLMDLAVRDRTDLGYAFLDGYLTRSADYDGAALSSFFQVYRSMVRAKVAGLQLEEHENSSEPALVERLVMHLKWADERLHRKAGLLILMCGFSGSGKSYLAERLVPELPAVRVRSDVVRRARAGLESGTPSNSPVDGGLYAHSEIQAVYVDMLSQSEGLLRAGENVVVDATFLDQQSRAAFQSAAVELGTQCVVVHCQALLATLEGRVQRREREGNDPSEAGLEVLHRQLSRFDPIAADEKVFEVDTEAELDVVNLAARIRGAGA